MLFKKPKYVLISLIIWRLISVYIVQTSHVPDEYWQSLEVAHNLAFNYGHLTWEWKSMIRSYIYPFLISILYKILATLNLDSVNMLTTIPRILQAALSGYADYRFYLWTKNKLTVFCLAINWYWYYCATRTLTNTLETSLTIIALSVFPWRKNKRNTSNDTKFLWILGFICAIRPTIIIPWIPLCLYHIFSSTKSIILLFFQYTGIVIFTLTYSTIIDTYCYGELIITPLEFFRLNIINNIADFYGKHHLLWYFFVGLPVISGLFAIYLPFVGYEIIKNYRNLTKQLVCLVSILWTIFIYSLLEHKEFRFLLPILPMIIYICTCTPFTNNLMSNKFKKLLIGILILTNILPGIYFSVIHQRGPLDTVKFLEDKLTVEYLDKHDIMYLTPCHAFPLYSHIHKNITIKFLTCEPNLHYINNYTDEADEFFQNPSNWLDDNYKNLSLPSLLIVYDNIVNRISGFLKNYKPIVKLFNSHFPQNNYGHYIIVYERIN